MILINLQIFTFKLPHKKREYYMKKTIRTMQPHFEKNQNYTPNEV